MAAQRVCKLTAKSEQRIAKRFGWEHTVLGICQGMDAVFLDGALTFAKCGEIRFGAAEGTEPSVVEAIDDPYARGHPPRGRARHPAPHVVETHAQRWHQPNVHGIRRNVRKRRGAGIRTAQKLRCRHARDACRGTGRGRRAHRTRSHPDGSIKINAFTCRNLSQAGYDSRRLDGRHRERSRYENVQVL